MYQPNPILIAKGYAPAAEVARKLSKSISTIHRMVSDQRIKGVREGIFLYIDLQSLIEHYQSNGNAVLVDAVKQLFTPTKEGPHVA